MKTKILLAASALLTSSFILQPTTVFAQGALTPPGAPAPTMKSLDQIEARTPISAVPFTITSPGSYYLTGNFTVGSGQAISITADGVTLDLNGFTITSTNFPAGGFGVTVNGGLHKNITIRNGNIQGGVTNVSGASYNGPGFLQGISAPGCFNVRVIEVNVTGCFAKGIDLGTGFSTVVDRCNVRSVGNLGITAGRVSDSVAEDCGGTGITANMADNCIGVGYSTGLVAENANNCKGIGTNSVGLIATAAINCSGTSSNSTGLSANLAQNCVGTSTASTGLNATNASNCSGVNKLFNNVGLSAATANNCYGSGVEGIAADTAIASKGIGSGGYAISATTVLNCAGYSTNGTGINAYAAQNSYGYSSTSGDGLYAYAAQNCFGDSGSGYGIRSLGSAENCFGQSTSSYGVYTLYSAQSCSGYSYTGTGLFAANIAIGCFGQSTFATGLTAYIGNSSWGSGTPALNISNKYNSP